MADDNSAEDIDCDAMSVEHKAKEFDSKEMASYNEAKTSAIISEKRSILKFDACE